MKKEEYKIEGFTLAVQNMDAVKTFYANVFGITFKEIKMYGSTLYSGVWGSLNILLCPAEIAHNTARQNRHQFDILVSDIDRFIEKIKKNGGKTIGEKSKDEQAWSIGVYDPDENSIVLKQLK